MQLSSAVIRLLTTFAAKSLGTTVLTMSVPFSTLWTQWVPHSGPRYENNLPSQTDRVFIMTNSACGLVYVLSRILDGSEGKVYVLAGLEQRADQAIVNIKSCYEGNFQCCADIWNPRTQRIRTQMNRE